MNKFQVIFDNGGNATLQTEGYTHSYSDMAQLAEDVSSIVKGHNPARDWDGNEIENGSIDTDSDEFLYQIECGGYKMYDQGSLAYHPDHAWRNVNEFNRAFFGVEA